MILLVEDDVVTRYAFARLLRVAGHEVVEAADGNEALTLLDRHPIELVVTDLQMPALDGFSLISRVATAGPRCLSFSSQDIFHRAQERLF